MKSIRALLSLVKFEHTIFALPFALSAAVVAARGIPSGPIIGWILVAMVGARSAAMAFNRIVDRDIDAKNPRTKNREIPAGIVTVKQAWGVVIFGAALLGVAAWGLNPLALCLSPLALLLVFGYSLTKRFTDLSHIILGLCLGIAPVGAWIAVSGEISLVPLLLSAAVTLWTAGFDIIYSLQDIEFDRHNALFSIPKSFGTSTSLWVSRVLHALMILFLVGFGVAGDLHLIYFIGVGLVAASLIYEQSLLRSNDLSKLNMAFFTMNGIVGVLFFFFTLADVLLLKS